MSETDKSLKRTEERHKLYLKQLAGEFADLATNDRRVAEECLRHPDKNVRIAALQILSDFVLARDIWFCKTCEQVILHDPHEQVKAIAVSCLGKCHESSNNTAVTSMFVELVQNDSLSAELRQSAYFGLLCVTGELKQRPEAILDFSFPDDVDWAYIDSIG